MPSLILKPGREKSLQRRHPWIFSGAIARMEGNPSAGETVDILNPDGSFLARAAFSPDSQIRARVWTFSPSELVNEDFFHRRLSVSISLRQVLHIPSDATRLIHAESDGLPGLIVDRYADVLVIQFLTAGAKFWRETLANQLLELTGLKKIYERSDAEVRGVEGLPSRVGPMRGSFSIDHDLRFSIDENGLKFQVDILHGHKTGFYLDQRQNRLRVRQLAENREVLDCFCYTGGFSINALAGRAKSVHSVDSSSEALVLCRENVALNKLPTERHEILEGDVFQWLRKFRDESRTFNMVILDPPKFAPTAAYAEKAARGYKDINLLAFKLLRPGGILVTFSCSGGISAELFQKIVAGAALDAGVDAQIVEHLAQAPDHPIALNFPEGAYLKGLVCIRA